MNSLTHGHLAATSSRFVIRTLSYYGLGAALSCGTALAQADTASSTPPPASSTQTETPSTTERIVVTGHKSEGTVIGAPKPLMQIGADEIRSYGVDTVTDLLTTISPETRSGRGATGNAPVILLNGKRISGLQEVNDLPFEAISRVEIFTEEEALRYGYAADQRVVNIITVKQFHAVRARAYGETSTDGGGENGALALSFTKLHDDRRINLSARYTASAWLRDSQRGVVPPAASSLYSSQGNLATSDGSSLDPALDSLAGQSVTTAGSPSLPYGQAATLTDILQSANSLTSSTNASAYTLQPRKHELSLNGVYADHLTENITSSINLSFDHQDQISLQGPARGIVTIPAGNPYSPFSQDVLLYRSFSNIRPLQQTGHTETGHVGLNFNGDLGSWKWNGKGSYDYARTVTQSQTGLSLTTAQTALDTGDLSFDPWSTISSSWLNSRLVNHGRTTSNQGQISGLLSGPVFSLPAGDASTSIAATGTLSKQNAASSISGVTSRSSISRDIGTLRINGDLPIANSKQHVLSFLGKLDANVNGAVNQVSHFGTLGTLGGGLTWAPTSWIQLPFSVLQQTEAPAASSLVAPTIETPNVTTYDYVRGESVQVTTISGGNRNLRSADRHELSLGAILSPPFLDGSRLHLNYVHDNTHHPALSLPTATAALQEAFPDNYQRNATGVLETVDLRPVNAENEKRTEWNATFSLSRPFGDDHAASDHKRHADSGTKGRYYVVLTQVWRLNDTVRLRSGLPAIDLLNGGTIGGLGGKPKHEVELQAGAYRNGFGVRLDGKWQSGTTTLGSTSAGSLYFSSLATLDVSVFVTLGDMPHWQNRNWAKNFRIMLSLDNISNTRIHVHNGMGVTPAGYQPAFMDPIGRTVGLSLRKTL
ncbi:TonB-dependent receptor [Gluconobacter japonicus]|nr:TonB-dependent receptor [Gluconobacter japonicus]